MRRAFTIQLAVGVVAVADYEDYDIEDGCCSCHIRPPCGYCTREWDCECEGNHADGHSSDCPEYEVQIASSGRVA